MPPFFVCWLNAINSERFPYVFESANSTKISKSKYDIYNYPLHEDFWLLDMVANGDILKHKKFQKMPYLWLLAIADKLKYENIKAMEAYK
jgi:hypothetical protein